jgi:hypothetical protein
MAVISAAFAVILALHAISERSWVQASKFLIQPQGNSRDIRLGQITVRSWLMRGRIADRKAAQLPGEIPGTLLVSGD